MQIAYSSEKHFNTLRPSKNVAVITLTGLPLSEKWGAVLNLPMEVLSPTGPEGSFAGMDAQARNIRGQLVNWLRNEFDHEGKIDTIIVQCQYGEIRSRIIARALVSSGVFTCDEGVKEVGPYGFITANPPPSTTFARRTVGIIAMGLEEDLSEG